MPKGSCSRAGKPAKCSARCVCGGGDGHGRTPCGLAAHRKKQPRSDNKRAALPRAGGRARRRRRRLALGVGLLLPSGARSLLRRPRDGREHATAGSQQTLSPCCRAGKPVPRHRSSGTAEGNKYCARSMDGRAPRLERCKTMRSQRASKYARAVSRRFAVQSAWFHA
jgi:hypothetical protein